MVEQNRRSIFAGVGVITLVMLITTGLLAAFLNGRCQSSFRDSLMVYPGAEMVSEEYIFLGDQTVELYSADSVATVTTWYTTERAHLMRAAVTAGTVRSLPPENWIIEPAPDQAGSRITFSATCP